MRKITVRNGSEAEKGRQKEYSLIVQMGDGDFTSTNRAGDLPKNKTAYTASIAEMNRHAEALDRYDDFSQLQILPKSYEKKSAKDKFGIARSETHVNDDVILKHQRLAVQRFLKELRGFGLLADIVGSGKTYEACAALSELAARGRINSLLLVVPEQVYSKWVFVLEMQFGLGEGVLYQSDATLNDRKLTAKDGYIARSADDNMGDILFNDDKGVLHPKRPMIVSAEDFAHWPQAMYDVLFDAIVVDEAHHLCAEEGEYSYAMYGLSRLMQVKKKANKTYCILCSATPHSGDIEHMFRLWYFIRCNGGIPSDFEEKDDSQRTRTYLEEREFYRTRVCHGASTVMEFMRKVSVEYTEREHLNPLLDYINARINDGEDGDRLLVTYAAELERLRNGHYTENGLSYNERFGVVQSFLQFGDPDVAEKINDYVAGEYHNGVLGSIMIRQANRVGKKRTVINYLFAPVKKIEKSMRLNYRGKDDGAVLDVAAMNGTDCVSQNMAAGDCVTFVDDKMSLYAYAYECEKVKSTKMRNAAYASLLLDGKNGVLPRLGMSDAVLGEGQHLGTLQFYEEQVKEMYGEDVLTRFVPTIFEDADIDAYKSAQLRNILDVNPDKRVLVFFDYDRRNTKLYAALEAELRKDKKLSGRKIIVGTESNKDAAVEEFNATDGAILLVEDAAFTEGVDMQTCNIIVNYQVPPDPIAMDQRIGRIFRLGQKNDIFIFSLADMRALEGYVLMYFARIGLLSSNSGDATIIAGCNNERSVTVQCKVCGKAAMYDEDEYNRKAEEDSPDLYCTNTELCKEGEGGHTRMNIIGTYDFKCDSCGEVLSRSEDGYKCRSTHGNTELDPHIMCNGGGMYDRDIYCHKICAISNCSRFMDGGQLEGRCKALEKYKKNPTVSEAVLSETCRTCPLNKTGSDCPEKCRLVRADGRNDATLIKPCSHCNESTCSPRPHVLEFAKDKWECKCPACGNGTMRPIRAHTFAEYVRSLWNYKFDKKEFCNRLKAEAGKVAYIKQILDSQTKS